jgi:mannose-6-phosphate isomerase-like protein (cupin superfamily)
MGSPSDTGVSSAGWAVGGDWQEVAPGEHFRLRVSSEQTNGRYTVLETIAAPGYGPPLHIHSGEDEHFVVLEGEVRFVCGERTFDASARAAVTIPRGVRHTWATETGVRMLVMFAPGGAERMFQELAKAEPSERAKIAAAYGCSVVGPPILG